MRWSYPFPHTWQMIWDDQVCGMIESGMGCEMIVSVCTHVANEMVESTAWSSCEMIISVCTHVLNEMVESAAWSSQVKRHQQSLRDTSLRLPKNQETAQVPTRLPKNKRQWVEEVARHRSATYFSMLTESRRSLMFLFSICSASSSVWRNSSYL